MSDSNDITRLLEQVQRESFDRTEIEEISSSELTHVWGAVQQPQYFSWSKRF